MFEMDVNQLLTDIIAIDTVRAFLSGAFLIVDLVLVGVFLLYAYWHYDNTVSWKSNLTVRGTLALGTYFLGRLIVQAWAWMALKIGPDGNARIVWHELFPLAIFGSFVALVGAVWVINVLTPPKWRRWNWAIGIALGAIFLYFTKR
jgi:hypothetical protein